MPKVLLVDGEPAMRFAISEVLDGSGAEILDAGSVDQALPQLEAADVVVTDFAMPGKNGLELLDAARALDKSLPVIVITAHGSERVAVEALKRGAYDYIAKPFDNDEVAYSIQRALETRSLRRRSDRADLEASAGVRVVGESPALQRALATAIRLADKDVTVLVRGETGTRQRAVRHAAARAAGARTKR